MLMSFSIMKYFFLSFFSLFLFSLLPCNAQSNPDNIIQKKVEHIIKNYDWGGLLKYQEENINLLSSFKSKSIIVLMGDSITEGWSYYDSGFLENNNLINRGYSGQTTSQMLLRFRKDVIALNPKAVVILAGINDIAKNTNFYDLKTVADNIFSMVELSIAHDIIPIICSVLPADKFVWNPEIVPTQKVIDLNIMLESYARKNNVMYLDYYSVMHNGKGGLKSRFTNDGVHLTMEGYEMLSNQILQAIKRLNTSPH